MCNGSGSHFHVIAVEEFDKLCDVRFRCEIGYDPEWARVLVDTVWQNHRGAMHCVQESRVKEFKELRLHGDRALLNLVCEPYESA